MKQTFSQTATKSASPLRYNIKRRLAELEPARASSIKTQVRRACGTTRSSLSRYINEKKTSADNMPVNVLQAFADQLGLHMEDLLNR